MREEVTAATERASKGIQRSILSIMVVVIVLFLYLRVDDFSLPKLEGKTRASRRAKAGCL